MRGEGCARQQSLAAARARIFVEGTDAAGDVGADRCRKWLKARDRGEREGYRGDGRRRRACARSRPQRPRAGTPRARRSAPRRRSRVWERAVACVVAAGAAARRGCPWPGRLRLGGRELRDLARRLRRRACATMPRVGRAGECALGCGGWHVASRAERRSARLRSKPASARPWIARVARAARTAARGCARSRPR